MRHLLFSIILLLSSSAIFAQKLPFTNQTEVGLLIADGSPANFTAQSFNGIKFSKSIAAGITVGVDAYREITILPLSLALKWNPVSNRPISPYVRINVGYGFDFLQRKTEAKWYGGGYIAHPAMGLRFRTKQKLSYILNLGLRQQKAVVYQPMSGWDIWRARNELGKDVYTYKRIYAGIGVEF